MSTFEGGIEEIPGISVDEFNNNAKCFFLSHCHTDHMRGLSAIKTEASVYMTSISALFIRKKCPQLINNVKILELGIPTQIELAQDDETPVNFVVTAISAGHCAGSCMLLFQIENCDVLYTGDFRISLKNARNIKLLKEIKDSSNTVVYLDSTFLKPTFPDFPTQTESVIEILKIVKKFLENSMNHKVNLIVPARYGYEYLLMELSTKLNEKIFIPEDDVFDQYSTISRLNACITTNEQKSRIFLKPTFVSDRVKFDEKDEVLNLQLSAMFWTNWKRGTSFVLQTGKQRYRVCYATHNSYNEIRDFLTFIKPKKINLNVLPPNNDQKQEMFNQIKSIQDQYLEKTSEIMDQVEPKKKFTFKRLRSLSNRRDSDKIQSFKKLKGS